jgi:lipoate-protein ligase A
MPTLVAPIPQVRWRRLKLSYPSTFRNLAVEEALARAFSTGVQTQPTIRIWMNPRAAVVGRFQEISAEVDIEQCELNGVQIARRFTGGGTVFHDEGTLNLTLVTQPKKGLADLKFQETNLQLVKETLDDLGIHCSSSRNSILVAGRKVCGSAAAAGLHFILWHCSILVDTNTRLLELSLAPSKSETKSRFVHSRWQEVTTLAKELFRPISAEEVSDRLEGTFEKRMGAQLETCRLSPEEERYSIALDSRKYSSSEWNLKGNRAGA